MWDADIYNRYDKERVQPSIDLVNRLRNKYFKRILDVGCGTGMSTACLFSAWKNAEIVGADLSAQMLQKAKEYLPGITFTQRDCSKPLWDMGTFDLIFSNAFLQWIPNQQEFIINSFEMLRTGGIFAAQIPLFEEMPANRCITNAEKTVHDKFNNISNDKYHLYTAPQYYDMITKATPKTTMWITEYCHQMDNHTEILGFLKGAALRPYLSKLNDDEQEFFMDTVLENLKTAYPFQENGKILFPFKRLFLLGKK